MTDKQLQVLMDKTFEANQIYSKLLKELEKEYEERYGFNPSDEDDDFFIDTFIMDQGHRITVQEMDEAVNIIKNNNNL